MIIKNALCVLLAGLAFLASCTGSPKNDEPNYKLAINDYLQAHLKDPSSYESLSFSEIDSVFSTLEHHPLYSNTSYFFDSEKRNFDHNSEMQQIWINEYSNIGRKQFKEFGDKMQVNIENMKKYNSVLDSIRLNFKEEWVGWSVTHSYRAKNGFGALDIYTKKFNLNKDLTEVTKVVE